jgi:hypothetical protein
VPTASRQVSERYVSVNWGHERLLLYAVRVTIQCSSY